MKKIKGTRFQLLAALVLLLAGLFLLGTGAEAAGNCPGHITGYTCPGHGHSMTAYSTCSWCGGNGYIDEPYTTGSMKRSGCTHCGGSGYKLGSVNGWADHGYREGHGVNRRCTNGTGCAYSSWGYHASVSGICYSGDNCTPVYGDHERASAIPCIAAACRYCGTPMAATAGHTAQADWNYTSRTGWHRKFCIYGCGTLMEEAANTYTVAYNANGGSGSVASQSATYGQAFSLRANGYARTGYSFQQWNTASNGSGAGYGAGQQVSNLTSSHNATVTLYARWAANSYTVSFNANASTAHPGTVGTASKSVTYDSTYGTLPTPARTGYTFLGWFTAASGGTQVTNGTQVKTAGNHTLYAHWKINTYTVTYNVNGGNSVSKASATVTYDAAVDLNVAAVKDGYVHIGWNTDPRAEEGTGSLKMPAGNLTVYAIYSIPVSDVREVYLQAWAAGDRENYRTYPLSRTGQTMRGHTYALPRTDISAGPGASPGWALIAWDNAGNYRVLKETEAAPVAQRFLQTVEHYYLDAASGEWVRFDTVSELKLKGEEYTPQYVTPPAGYEPNSIDEAYIVEEDTTTMAYYTPVSYTLYFDANGGSCREESRSMIFGEPYGELPTAERHGYKFLGWYTEPLGGDRIVSSQRYEVPGDSTVYAHWEVNVRQVVYDYRTNGGTSASREYADTAFGSEADLTVEAYKNGWEHIGWNTDPMAEEGLASYVMGDEDTVLYAIYQKTITLTFIDRKGDETVTSRASAVIYNRAEGGSFAVPGQAGMTGWQAEGWSFAKEGDSAIDAAPGMRLFLKEDTVLYGRYSREVTVSYDTNGSPEERPEEVKKRHHNASGEYVDPVFTLPSAPVLDGYSFAGWEKDTDGQLYEPGQELELQEDTRFTVSWDKYPEIEAYDRYFTLEQAQAGAVTPEELLRKVSGTDREDGTLAKRTAVIVINYRPEDFTGFETDGAVSVTYRATDSFGNRTEKTVMAYITDTALKDNPVQDYVRFISSRFYKDGNIYVAASEGGLEEDSIWKEDDAYRAALDYALGNRKTGEDTVDTQFMGKDYTYTKPGSGTWEHEVETWTFSREAVKEIRKFIEENGYGKYKMKSGIDNFYETFQKYREPGA